MPDKDTLSYFIGMSVANSIKQQDLTVDVDTIAVALRDVLSNRPTRMTDAQFNDVKRQLGGALRAKMAAQRQAEQARIEKEGAINKAKGDAFLAKNATEPGVISLTNGLQYKVIKPGIGAIPGPHDNVIVSYKGSFLDGTVFDQSTNFTTPVSGRVIVGWSQILQMMPVGSRWQLFIPPNLAYGLRGNPPKIPPDTTLIFDLELLVDKPPTIPPMAAAPPKATPSQAPASTTPVVSGQIIKVPSADELKKGAKIEVITNLPPGAQ